MDTATPDVINQTAPGHIKVIRRNGTITPFDAEKIAIAMTKTFLAMEGDQAAQSNRIREQVSLLSQKITQTLMTRHRLHNGGILHIEDIQDQVELELMREGEYKVAKAYVLYLEERRRLRDKAAQPEALKHATLQVTIADGSLKTLDLNAMREELAFACKNLADVTPDLIFEDAKRNLFDKVPEKEVSKSLILSARTLIEKEPNYSYVAARLLLNTLRREAYDFLGVSVGAEYFQSYL